MDAIREVLCGPNVGFRARPPEAPTALLVVPVGRGAGGQGHDHASDQVEIGRVGVADRKPIPEVAAVAELAFDVAERIGLDRVAALANDDPFGRQVVGTLPRFDVHHLTQP